MVRHTPPHRLFATVCVALICAAAPLAHAQAPGAAPDPQDTIDTPGETGQDRANQEDTILLLLSAHHELPPKRLFTKASPDARAILLELAQRDEFFKLHRYRALEALGSYWADGEVFTLYAGILAGDEDVLLKHRILMFSARAFGDRSVPMIQPYVRHDDYQLRRTAIEALIGIGTPDALTPLRTALPEEESEPLRALMERALAGVR